MPTLTLAMTTVDVRRTHLGAGIHRLVHRRDPGTRCLRQGSGPGGVPVRPGDIDAVLSGIADKLKSHDAFIGFWRQVLPNPIHTVRYETLVSQTEPEARRMIESCGLPWEAQCVRPHENTSQVNTASKWQVRQPINKGSVERWRRYEAELEPLRQALGDLATEQPV